MFKDLKRVVCQVSDLSAAKKWYSNFLEINPIYDSSVTVVFLIGEVTFSLVTSPNPLKEDSGRIAVYWEVDDVDITMRRMVDLGATVNAAAMNYPGKRLARVMDPFGNIVGLAGNIPGEKGKSVDNQPSDTAMYVAFYRALAVQDERPEIKGPDVYAHLFLSEEVKKPLSDPLARESAMFKLVRPMYASFTARTAYIDQMFEEAIHSKTPQIVILGAGYDTRAYRFHSRLHETKIFELDAPATQNRKKDILQKESISMPPQLSFVPINFKTDDLSETLKNAGFNRNLKSLFIWEGVIYYLAEADIDKALNAIKINAIPGSKLCFDYITQRLPSSSSAEPIKFWIEEAKIQSFLAARGFNVLDHLNPDEIAKRYLTLRDGTLGEKPVLVINFILAERAES